VSVCVLSVCCVCVCVLCVCCVCYVCVLPSGGVMEWFAEAGDNKAEQDATMQVRRAACGVRRAACDVVRGAWCVRKFCRQLAVCCMVCCMACCMARAQVL
jgi:hypothetical protein